MIGFTKCSLAPCLLAEGAPGEAAAAWREGAAVLRELGDLDTLEELRREMSAACAKAGVAEFGG